MSLKLSAAEVRLIERAVRALSATDREPDQWRDAACDAVREVFRADYSLYAEHTDESMGFLARSPAAAQTAIPRLMEEMRATAPPHPLVRRLMTLERAGRVSVYTTPLLNRLLNGRFKETPFYKEVVVPGGMRHIAGMVSVANDGIRRIAIGWKKERRVRPTERTLALLRLLHPAFDAGAVNLRVALAARRNAEVIAACVNDGIILLGADGRERLRNDALTRLLEGRGDRAAIEAAILSTAQAVAAAMLATGRGEAGMKGLGIPISTTVTTPQQTYTLRASPITALAGGPDTAVLVTVSAAPAVLPTTAALRQRFRLTPREAEVALLLAQRRTDVEIAAQLGVSWHTVRRHVEHVLSALGTSSRHAIAGIVTSAGEGGTP